MAASSSIELLQAIPLRPPLQLRALYPRLLLEGSLNNAYRFDNGLIYWYFHFIYSSYYRQK